jgi:cation:H+ antiporter
VTLVTAVLAVVFGLGVLVVAADRFVVAAEGIAVHRRWSPAVIGAVVVGFGTSVPELVTSAAAAFSGEPEIAIGNAAGSNVANLLLILGLAAVVAPLRHPGRGPGRDVAIAASGGALLLILSLDGHLRLVDGLLLLLALAGAVAWQIGSSRASGIEVAATGPFAPLVGWAAAGLIGVVVGAWLLVRGATAIAMHLEVPSIIIGSVLVAIGTSLPELATAIASARRAQTELLLGNLIGSNTFNALGVVGVSAVIGAARRDPIVVDLPALLVVAAAGLVTLSVGVAMWRTPRLGRLAGGLLVVGYVATVPLLIWVS